MCRTSHCTPLTKLSNPSYFFPLALESRIHIHRVRSFLQAYTFLLQHENVSMYASELLFSDEHKRPLSSCM